MDFTAEFVCFGVAAAGWFCVILTRFLPMWSVSGTVENSTTTLPLYWDGVWLNWQQHTTGRLHCVFYQSLLSLTEHFNTWKIIIICSIALGFIAVVVYAVGWIRYPKYIWCKVASGPIFVLSGLVLLVVLSWTTHLTDLKADFELKRVWGAAIFTGWTATVLLVLGGAALSFVCYRAVQKKRRDERDVQAEQGAQYPLQPTHSPGFIQDSRN